MEHAISLFFRSIFVDNMIFAYFLGMCSYLAVSKNVKTALGLGIAVTFVLVVTLPVNYLLQTKVLAADGILGIDLSFLSFILFIAHSPFVWGNNSMKAIFFSANLGSNLYRNSLFLWFFRSFKCLWQTNFTHLHAGILFETTCLAHLFAMSTFGKAVIQ